MNINKNFISKNIGYYHILLIIVFSLLQLLVIFRFTTSYKIRVIENQIFDQKDLKKSKSVGFTVSL